MSKETLRYEVYEYIKKKYKAKPEYPWMSAPDYAVFRHEDNKKWFALIMDISKDKLGLKSRDVTDILNIKLADPLLMDLLSREPGFFRGYHMHKGNWLTVLLDGSVDIEKIRSLLDESFAATASKAKKAEIREAKEWIIPANPKYYDIAHAFDNEDTIDWKQGSGIKKGDTVYMYAGAPISAIIYACKVTQTDIPFNYSNGNLTINSLMRIKLRERVDPKKFTFEILKKDYGIFAVRGPRGIPHSLSEKLKKTKGI